MRLIRYVECDRGLVAYRVQGDGELDILHLPGWMSSVESNDDEPHVARFDRRLRSIGRLIDFDLPGLGLSDGDADFDVDSLAASVLCVLDAVGSRRVALVAQGIGHLAIRFAAEHPERVRSLVLVNAYARAIVADDYPIGFPTWVLDRWVDQSSAPDDEWTVGDLDQYALMTPSLADDRQHRDWMDRAVRHGARPAVARRYRRFVTEADVRDDLARVTAPTLVIARHDNVMVPPRFGRYIAEHIRGARFVELPGTDHFAYSGDTDDLVDEIENFLIGRRRGSLDRVLATILFTDYVDSTGRASALHDSRWRAHLDSHDTTIRAEITRYGGRVVNTTGDGFMSEFDVPSQAIRCAGAIVASGLPVRVGLHTGECERRGSDLAGLAVHIAARVAALANAGEILVTRTVRDLVAGSEFEFLDHGEHALKGVPDHWHLYATVESSQMT